MSSLGCAPVPDKENPNVGGEAKRFSVMQVDSDSITTDFFIIVDNDTGHEYLYVSGSNGRGGVIKLEE